MLEGVKPRADNTLSSDVGYYKIKLGSSGLYGSAEHAPTKQVARLPRMIKIVSAAG